MSSKFGAEEYDKIIDLLHNNPLISIQAIASSIKGVNSGDIGELFSEIRETYNTKEATNEYISTKIRQLDPVIYINGILKSFLSDNLDQSLSLGLFFKNVSQYYQEEEMKTNIGIELVRYSELYKYFAALMNQEKLPILNQTECGILLTLIYELSNFKNVACSSDKQFITNFMNKIKKQTAQFLLKVALPSDKWNGTNEKALVEAFKLPVSNKNKNDSKTFRDYQKQVVTFSLNPFNIDPEMKANMKSFIWDILDNDNAETKDLNQMCRSIGVDSHKIVTIKDLSNPNVVIVSETMASTSQDKSTISVNPDEETIEKEIRKRMAKHQVVDLDAYHETLLKGVPQNQKGAQSKKRRLR